jgi:hypothetical protein
MTFATDFRVGLSSEKALGVVDALSEAKTDDAHSLDSTHSTGSLADIRANLCWCLPFRDT